MATCSKLAWSRPQLRLCYKSWQVGSGCGRNMGRVINNRALQPYLCMTCITLWDARLVLPILRSTSLYLSQVTFAWVDSIFLKWWGAAFMVERAAGSRQQILVGPLGTHLMLVNAIPKLLCLDSFGDSRPTFMKYYKPCAITYMRPVARQSVCA